MKYLGKEGDAMLAYPYGFHAHAPTGELSIILSGQNGNRVSIPVGTDSRVKELPIGEVVIHHPESGSKIHFRKGGTIEIEGDTELVGDFSITGNVEITGTLKVNGVDVGDQHKHLAGTYLGDAAATTPGPVQGISGAPTP
jgi:phage gp45-like